MLLVSKPMGINYSVVIEEIDPDRCEYEIDDEATEEKRKTIRTHREEWLQEDSDAVTDRFHDAELDLNRRYGVILDWSIGELLERTTEQFRDVLQKRAASEWS